jgi:hypothetical protein
MNLGRSACSGARAMLACRGIAVASRGRRVPRPAGVHVGPRNRSRAARGLHCPEAQLEKQGTDNTQRKLGCCDGG